MLKVGSKRRRTKREIEEENQKQLEKKMNTELKWLDQIWLSKNSLQLNKKQSKISKQPS